jgi:hypothetical protein
MFHVVQSFLFYSLSNCEYTNNTLAVLSFLPHCPVLVRQTATL